VSDQPFDWRAFGGSDAAPKAFEPVTFMDGASGNQLGALNGTTNTAVVPAPGQGQSRMGHVSVANKSGGAIIVNVYINEGTGTTRLVDTLSVADDTTYSSADKFPKGIPIRDFQSIEVDLDAAGTPEYFAWWSEPPHIGRVG
jgi:hypothetical protein